jgi:hypothetical protein
VKSAGIRPQWSTPSASHSPKNINITVGNTEKNTARGAEAGNEVRETEKKVGKKRREGKMGRATRNRLRSTGNAEWWRKSR